MLRLRWLFGLALLLLVAGCAFPAKPVAPPAVAPVVTPSTPATPDQIPTDYYPGTTQPTAIGAEEGPTQEESLQSSLNACEAGYQLFIGDNPDPFLLRGAKARRASCYADTSATLLASPMACDRIGAELKTDCYNAYYTQAAFTGKNLAGCGNVQPTADSPTAADVCRVRVIHEVLLDPRLCPQVVDETQRVYCNYYLYADQMLDSGDRQFCYQIPQVQIPSPYLPAIRTYARNDCLIMWKLNFSSDASICEEMRAQPEDYARCLAAVP